MFGAYLCLQTGMEKNVPVSVDTESVSFRTDLREAERESTKRERERKRESDREIFDCTTMHMMCYIPIHI